MSSERRMAFARCSMLFGSSWRWVLSMSHLFETRTEGTDDFSRASRRQLAILSESGWRVDGSLTQDDRDVFKGVLVGDVVQGACGVNTGHTGVQGPGDSVFLVDVDVFESAL